MNEAISLGDVPATATIRIIAKKKGKPLTGAETFHHTVKIMGSIDYPEKVLDVVVKTDVCDAFRDVFMKRLKSNPQLKNQIGGIEWCVDLMNVEYEKP